jgi:hypothetical protein
MSIPSRVAPTVAEVHRAVLADMPASNEVFAAGLTTEPTVALIEVLADLDGPPTVRLLARESVLKWLRRDFHPASTAADLAVEGTLSLRTTEDRFENGLVVGEETVVSVVTTDERIAGLGTDDAEFVQAMRERCADAWEAADSFNLRTPARSRVYETLADEIGPEVAGDFQAMVDAVETTRSGGYGSSDEDTLDEVALALLAAANQGIQLYEISRWGEDAGLASKATFSRTKTRLEEHGVLATEKVPIDVGRPRLRLVLGDDERLQDADSEDLAGTAQSCGCWRKGVPSGTPDSVTYRSSHQNSGVTLNDPPNHSTRRCN